MYLKNHPNSLLPCKSGDAYGLFAGAGISVNSGIPLVNALIKKIVDCLPLKKVDAKLLLSRRFPFEAFIQKIKSEVDISEVLKIFGLGKPNQSHKLIAKLARTGKLKVIITTNFDTLIEQALKKEKVVFKTIFTIENLEKFKNRKGKLILLKIHGSIEDQENIGVILERITAKTNISSIQNVVKNFFHYGNYENIIFAGYSCSDYFDIVPEIEKAFKTRKNIFFIKHIEESDIVVDLISSLPPFKRFKTGNIISTNTDLLVKKLWRKMFLKRHIQTKSNSELWENLIDKWTVNTSLNKNSINGLILCGKLMTFIGYYERAIKYYNRALKIAMNKSLNEKITKIFLYSAQVYSHLGMYPEAKKAFTEALVYCRKLKEWNNYAKIISDIGSTNRKEGNLKEAISLQNKALRIFNRVKNYEEVRTCYIIKGNIYLNSEKYSLALQNYQKALHTSINAPNLPNYVILLNSLAAVSIKLSDLLSAKKYLARAEKISEKLGVPRIIAAIRYNYGSYYEKQNDYKKTVSEFSIAIKIVSETQDFYQHYIMLKNRGQIYEKIKNYKKALNDVLACLEFIKQQPLLKKQDYSSLKKQEKRLRLLIR